MLQQESPVGVRADARQPLGPTLARMKRAYADLQAGRFVVLADFNTAPQADLFRIVDADGSDQTRVQPQITVQIAREATGPGGLEARLRPGDRLLFDGVRSEHLALVPDWSRYALLLMSIYGPPDGAELRFGIHSDAEASRQWSRMLSIEPGWNLIRIDLRDVQDAVDLEHVRALSWAAPGRTRDLRLVLDDLILCDNTRYVLGRDADEGQLYAYTRGLRIYVGARGRFELAFSDGVIVEWRARGAQNLVPDSGLGPWPLPLSDDWAALDAERLTIAPQDALRSWGRVQQQRQAIVEASPFRVVIESRWTFRPATWVEEEAGERASCAWRYVVYPQGRVLVTLTCRARRRGWPGTVVACAADLRSDPRLVPVPAEPAYPTQEPVSYVLLARPGREQPDFLWVPAAVQAAAQRRVLPVPGSQTLRAVVGNLEPADLIQVAQTLWLWPHDLDGAPEATALAGDYQHPARLAVSVGALRRDAAGDLNGDGFNESEGCYELRLEGNLLRFNFQPGSWMRDRPVFRVADTRQRRCWVYADGRIVRSVGRDADGNLMFLLPQVITEPVDVEVVTAVSTDSDTFAR